MDALEERYSRQVRFAGLGAEGQRRLRESRVAIAGCGALGTLQAAALARAGVGFLRIIDRDYVEPSNLQRQWLFEEADAVERAPKAAAAARRLRLANSDITCEAAVADLTADNADDLLGDVDLILDGTDNFEARYLINDFAVSRDVPWIYGAAVGSYGLTLPVAPGRTPCLKCVYPNPPEGPQPTCETAGVLNAITGAIAALQAGDALKILGAGRDAVRARITTVDVWSGEVRQVALGERDPECPCCARHEFPHLETRARAPISLCGRNAVQIHEHRGSFDLRALGERLAGVAPVRITEFALRASVDPYELTVFADGRAIIKGTTDPGVARSVYARYVG